MKYLLDRGILSPHIFSCSVGSCSVCVSILLKTRSANINVDLAAMPVICKNFLNKSFFDTGSNLKNGSFSIIPNPYIEGRYCNGN